MNRKAMTILALLVLSASAMSFDATAGENHATFGTQWWQQSKPEARFREYMDLQQGAFLESFGVFGKTPKYTVDLQGTNGLRRDQVTEFSYNRGSRWRLDLTNAQLPHLISQITRTPYTEVSPGVFVLPDSFQRQAQTYLAASNTNAYVALMNDLLRGAPRVESSLNTEVTTARLRSRPAAGWGVELKGVRRLRDGHKPFGAPFGFNSVVDLLEPIHQRMLDADATVGYQRNKVRASVSAGMSQFTNDVDLMRWDNPKRLQDRTTASAYTAGDGSASGQLDLYPDNQVVRGNIALGVSLPRRTQFTATAGMSQGTQDDDLLPYTINTALLQSNPDSLPFKTLDGKVVRTNLDLRLTSRGWGRAAGTLRYHWTDVDNQTEERTLSGVSRMDQSFTAGGVMNKADSHTRGVLGVDLHAQPMDPVALGLTYEMVSRERNHREVEKDGENVVQFTAQWDAMEQVAVGGKIRHADRKLDAFHDSDYKNAAGVFIEQPNLRRYDVADRVQDVIGGNLEWMPAEKFEAGVEYENATNDFKNSIYGLQKEESQTVMASGTLRPGARVELTGGYGYEVSETTQASNETNAAAPPTADAATDWSADIRDRNVFVFLNGEWWARPKKLALALDYVFSRALTDYDLTGSGSLDLPSTFSRRHQVTLQATWRVAGNLDVSGRWGYDKYDVEDFQNENVPLLSIVNGSPIALYLGDSTLDYYAHRLQLLATRRF